MRDFVDVFRTNLVEAGAPTDDETVWRLLRRFQILVFDFESPGSDYEHRARDRARLALAADQAHRAGDLWPVLIVQAGACARAGGVLDRPSAVNPLETEHGFRFEKRADLSAVDARLSETADRALEEIKDQVGGVRLARTQLIDQASAALEEHRMLSIVGAPGVGKSSIMQHLARRLQPEGRIIVLRNGRIIPGGWLPMAHAIGCTVSRDELFNELGCGGGATLFIDNIDQIEGAGEWATVTDLLTGVVKNPGWRAVFTGGIGNDEWRIRLPTDVRNSTVATLEVEAISDDETAVLSEGNSALAIILGTDHPARGIARNLFYLSRMIELGGGIRNLWRELRPNWT
jgi:energy-coupling factor transporter ATP-binding protein EcfA2